ncbi:MAG: type II secretion system F family protein [Candidatus Eremiobacterota bacterium]
MATFRFKALDMNDKVVEGSVHADGLQMAQTRLRKIYKSVLEISEQDTSILDRIGRESIRVPLDSLSIYTRQLATMIGAGISIHRSVRFLGKGDCKPLNTILAKVSIAIEGGKPLSRALQEHPKIFSEVYIALVKAGETSGRLEVALNKLSLLLEKSVRIRKRVQATFAYPSVLAVCCLAIICLFVFYVVPMMRPIFEQAGVTLPLVTRILIWMVDTAKNPILMGAIIVTTLGAFVGIRFVLNSMGENSPFRIWFDENVLKIPLVGAVIRLSTHARVMYTMSTMMDAGISIAESLESVERVAGNSSIRIRLKRARASLMDGMSLGGSLEKHEAFGRAAIQMIKVGEESGKVSDMMSRVAKLYEDEAEMMMDTMASAIEPLMLAVMGFIVGFITLACFMPMVQFISEL